MGMQRAPLPRATATLLVGLLALGACTTRTELRPGTPEIHFTTAWADSEIAELPKGADLLSRYELHDQPDLLLHDPPGVRRTGYVIRYATTMQSQEVVDYYLARYGDRWAFDLRPLNRRSRMTAYRGDVKAEIRLVLLVRGPRPLRGSPTTTPRSR